MDSFSLCIIIWVVLFGLGFICSKLRYEGLGDLLYIASAVTLIPMIYFGFLAELF